MTVSILSERRSLQPFGLEGGGPAQPGLNILQRPDGRIVNVGAKATVELKHGERLRLLTPGSICSHQECVTRSPVDSRMPAGGGGYGTPRQNSDADNGRAPKRRKLEDHGLKGSLQTYKHVQESV